MGARARSHVRGLLTRRGSAWDRAFGHISEHFRRAAPDKPTHSIFIAELRNEPAIRDLLFRAASKPSSAISTKLTDIGTPSVRLEREFKKQIGMEPEETWLCVIVEVSNRSVELITAYPIVPPSSV